ncbi:thioredoxin peroxidase Tpx1, variant 2 [Ancistrocladus abbreviatus]
MAPIAVGDTLPDGNLSYFDENDQLQTVSTHSLAAGKKVVLFGVPGAFTPTCRGQPCLKPRKGTLHQLVGRDRMVNHYMFLVSFPTSAAHAHVLNHMKHVPGFIEKAEELKSKGVAEILCISVNDPFVMKAWAKTYPENKHLKFLADGSAEYTRALGLELDLSEKGLGIRSKRFALLADDLKVKAANVESGGEFTVSSAEDIMKAL